MASRRWLIPIEKQKDHRGIPHDHQAFSRARRDMDQVKEGDVLADRRESAEARTTGRDVRPERMPAFNRTSPPSDALQPEGGWVKGSDAPRAGKGEGP